MPGVVLISAYSIKVKRSREGMVALTRLLSDDVYVAVGGMVAFGPQDVTGGDVIDAWV